MKLTVAVGDNYVRVSGLGPYNPDVLQDAARHASELLSRALELHTPACDEDA